MKQLTINVSETKFKTFLEFLKTLDYIEISTVDKNPWDELQNSLNQVKQMKDGKIAKQKAAEFLNEL